MLSATVDGSHDSAACMVKPPSAGRDLCPAADRAESGIAATRKTRAALGIDHQVALPASVAVILIALPLGIVHETRPQGPMMAGKVMIESPVARIEVA
jgi:hypothetical protein